MPRKNLAAGTQPKAKFFAEPGYLHDVKAELSYRKKINCEYTYTFLFESCSCCCFF